MEVADSSLLLLITLLDSPISMLFIISSVIVSILPPFLSDNFYKIFESSYYTSLKKSVLGVLFYYN